MNYQDEELVDKLRRFGGEYDGNDDYDNDNNYDDEESATTLRQFQDEYGTNTTCNEKI